MRTLDTVSRFDDRVENYLKYRPRYPQEIIPFLQQAIDLQPTWHVADIGAGTGFLAEHFLAFGCRVVGLEPNQAMREAGDKHLHNYTKFTGRNGTAEATGLDTDSVDLISAGQAFHWFDPAPARKEFQRILRPGGWVVLVWNSRPSQVTPVVDEYDAILEALNQDYQQVAQKYTQQEAMDQFFAGLEPFQEKAFANPQQYTWEQLRGRALSSSYAPLPPDPRHEQFVDALQALFERHQQDGVLAFIYETNLFWGQLA